VRREEKDPLEFKYSSVYYDTGGSSMLMQSFRVQKETLN
jgi:hypothetical protein